MAGTWPATPRPPAAFAELRVPWSRSEAYADLVEQAWADGYDGLDDDGQPYTDPLPAVPFNPETGLPRRPGRGPGRAAVPDPPRPPAAPGHPRDHRRRAGAAGAEPDPGPARRARPTSSALIIWFVLTGRKDLAPPPDR